MRTGADLIAADVAKDVKEALSAATKEKKTENTLVAAEELVALIVSVARTMSEIEAVEVK